MLCARTVRRLWRGTFEQFRHACEERRRAIEPFVEAVVVNGVCEVMVELNVANAPA